MWFVLAAIFIGANLVMIWVMHGFGRVAEVLSPYNLWNIIAVMITMAPGAGALMIAEKLAMRAEKESLRRNSAQRSI